MLCVLTANNNGELSNKVGDMFIPYDIDKIVRDTKYFDYDTVAVALDIFKKLGLIYKEENVFKITNFNQMVGSESSSAKRVREYRARQKALQCNSDVTDSNDNVTSCNTEIEKEVESDREIENRENIDYQQIADLYNETCVSFPRLTKLSDSRKKAIRARLKQYSVDDFRRMFEMAESSDFLKGKNDRNWSATFDWMVKDANMAKILDGNYQDKADFKPHEETREEREARLMREWEEEHKNRPKYNFPPIPEGVEPVIWGDDLE